MFRQTIARWLGAIVCLVVPVHASVAPGQEVALKQSTEASGQVSTAEHRPARLAIVIDDIGYSELRGMRTIRLPGPMTLAVLPFAPHSRVLVDKAIAANKDIIIHQPMEPHPSPAVREEEGTLKLGMSDHEFDRALTGALAAIPESIGLSNHTGSLLTAHQAPMTRVMRRLSQHNMFFLDSRTTAQTVALKVARNLGVRAVRRDVFLDHTPTAEAIHASFTKAIRVARRKGHAVLVGHPYPVTLKYLEYALASLPEDVQLVGAAELAWAGPAGNLAFTDRPVMLALPQHPGSLRISLGR